MTKIMINKIIKNKIGSNTCLLLNMNTVLGYESAKILRNHLSFSLILRYEAI